MIPGFVDKFSIFAQRLLPRRVVPKLVAKISRPSELLYIAASIWPQKWHCSLMVCWARICPFGETSSIIGSIVCAVLLCLASEPLQGEVGKYWVCAGSHYIMGGNVPGTTNSLAYRWRLFLERSPQQRKLGRTSCRNHRRRSMND